MKNHKDETKDTVTPQKALDFLIEGNNRFLNNLSVNRNYMEIVDETKDGQFPFVSILSCSDSRVPVELVFNQGLGDIFSVRLAGNVASEYAIGSLEFACSALDTKLIVVLGHTSCGAVKGACDNLQGGNLYHVLSLIQPAVSAETTTVENRNGKNEDFIMNVAHLNVQQQITNILDNSSIIRKKLADKEIAIVGAMYDLASGKVTFYEEDLVFDINHQFNKINANI